MANLIPIVELLRIEENKTHGTFGILRLNKEMFCITLEPCDENNAKGISSIPAQQYICNRYSSAKYPSTFQVMDVPERESILFHPGNTIKDTAGCILLGKSVYDLRYERGIANSGETFRRFMSVMESTDEFHLTIREVY